MVTDHRAISRMLSPLHAVTSYTRPESVGGMIDGVLRVKKKGLCCVYELEGRSGIRMSAMSISSTGR